MREPNKTIQDISIELRGDPADECMIQYRQMIRGAMTALGMMPEWKERYYEKQAACIYINGKKVDANTTIDLQKIITAVRSKRKKIYDGPTLKKHLSFAFALLIAFFPKCPFCWAAYLSALGIFKANAISYQPWMLPVLIVMMILNICSLYVTGKRHQWKPFALSIAAAAVIITNRIYFNTGALIYVGTIMLIMAAMWNSLTKRLSVSLRKYVTRTFSTRNADV